MSAKRRRLSTSVLAMTVAILGEPLATGASAAKPFDPASVHGRYIVQTRGRALMPGVQRTARTKGAEVVGRMTATHTIVVTGSRATAAALARDPRVVSVVPDRVERIVPPEFAGDHKSHKPQGDGGRPDHGSPRQDPALKLPGLMWDYSRIGAQQAWQTTTGRPSVVVGVADTGLDFTHSELSKQVVGVQDFTDPTLCKTIGGASDADMAAEFGGPVTTDWNGHGSWIGGNIAGALDGTGINGIAPGVGLVALKIAEWCGYAWDSSILASFQYAADHGIDVVSISFGGYLDRRDPEQEAIYKLYADSVRYATSKGTVIVAASGNEHLRLGGGGLVLSHGPLTIPGDPFEDYYGLYETPGGIPGVVMVSATGNVVAEASRTCATGTFETADATCKPRSDAHQSTGVGRENQLTYYSNYGPRIDVAAPGGARKFNVPSIDRGGTGGFPYTTADSTTAFETFGITSNWATEIPCFTFTSSDFYPDECYSTIQGTSMATPHVSAVVALIASAHPWMQHHPLLLVSYLKRTADNIRGNTTPALSETDKSGGDRTGGSCPTGYCHLGGPAISDSDAYGAGLVDAEAAVR